MQRRNIHRWLRRLWPTRLQLERRLADLARTNQLLYRDLQEERMLHGETARRVQVVEAERRQILARSADVAKGPWVDARLPAGLVDEVTGDLAKRFGDATT